MVKILFVCNGNICRSPMAEFIFRHMMAENNEVMIASAGVSGTRAGHDMTEGAKKCLEVHGVPFERREAVVFHAGDYLKYDMIVCMDEWNKHNLKTICLNDPHNKIFKLLDFTRSTKGMSNDEAMIYTNVSDPYDSKDYERTFSEIYEGCMGLKNRLKEE